MTSLPFNALPRLEAAVGKEIYTTYQRMKVAFDLLQQFPGQEDKIRLVIAILIRVLKASHQQSDEEYIKRFLVFGLNAYNAGLINEENPKILDVAKKTQADLPLVQAALIAFLPESPLIAFRIVEELNKVYRNLPHNSEETQEVDDFGS